MHPLGPAAPPPNRTHDHHVSHAWSNRTVTLIVVYVLTIIAGNVIPEDGGIWSTVGFAIAITNLAVQWLIIFAIIATCVRFVRRRLTRNPSRTR